MKWKRTRTEEGLMRYTAGPYTVEERTKGGWWYASGPDVDSEWLRKSEAQRATEEVAKRRIGDGLDCQAHPGDRVVCDDKRTGYVAAVLTNQDRTLYLIRLARKRRCLFRGEFTVVLP